MSLGNGPCGCVPVLVNWCSHLAAHWSLACESQPESQPRAPWSWSWTFMGRQHKLGVIHKLHKLHPLLCLSVSPLWDSILKVLNTSALFMKYQTYTIPRQSIKLFPEVRNKSSIYFRGTQLASQLCRFSASLDTLVLSYGQDSGSSWKTSI